MSAAEAEVRIKRAIDTESDSLDLRGLGLKSLPQLPQELQQLRVLELGSNRLTQLPDEFAQFQQLQRLGLGNNRLRALPPQLPQLQALVSLDLSENQLRELQYSPESWPRLVELSLYANQLMIVPEMLLALAAIERMDLAANKLSALSIPPAARRGRLQVLDLSHNQLQALPEGLEHLQELRVLDLGHNQIQSLDGIQGLPQLEQLDVSNNRLESLPSELRNRLPGLRRLHAGGNKFEVSDAVAGHLGDESLRTRVGEAIRSLTSGGDSGGEGVHFLDRVPFSFDFSLSVKQDAADALIDLYYKRFSGQDVSVELGDGGQLDLRRLTRTAALHTVSNESAASPLIVRVGPARREAQRNERSQFVIDALTRLSGTSLISSTGVSQFAAGMPVAGAVLQWNRPARRTVGVGFSPFDHPLRPLVDTQPLPRGRTLWLWCAVETGTRIIGAIGGGQSLSPAVEWDHADLVVAIFTNPDGFELRESTGVLRLQGPRCFVVRPAGIPKNIGAESSRRLFFEVKTPKRIGQQQLRVHLYHRGLLVQALDLRAWIGAGSPDSTPLTIKSDYVLSSGLQVEQLQALGEHTLSIFANESPDDMAGFRFFGGNGRVKSTASVESTKLNNLVDKARRALRQVSWDSIQAYDENRDTYRYEPAGPKPDFKADVVRLAKCGYQIWDSLAKQLSGEGSVETLQEMMRRPGVVQLGLKESSTQLLPLALLYDHPIETQLDGADDFTLCPAYAADPSPCLAGDCPNRDDLLIVCPSGFWGFRHSIGIPVGVNRAPDATSDIAASKVRLVASAYTGDFKMREAHLKELETLVGAGAFEAKLTRQETVRRMYEGGFQVLYFYCHGGVADGAPFVRVGGSEEKPNRIARDTLAARRIKWTAPRSLVVINGCHTTAMEPENAIDLVNGFVDTARASGVIGTEITVFEPLATKMGEEFLRALLAGADVGTALCNARRKLLLAERPNPLGLVYLPFALATLKLEQRAVTQ